jgi:hypothetical protein
MGEYRYRSTILDLGTRWKWMISFTPRPLYSQGKSPLYPLDRRLGGSQSRYGRCRIKTNLLRKLGIETRAIQPVARRYTDWAITAPLELNIILVSSVTDSGWHIIQIIEESSLKALVYNIEHRMWNKSNAVVNRGTVFYSVLRINWVDF